MADARYKEKMKKGLKELMNRPAFFMSEVIFENNNFYLGKKVNLPHYHEFIID